MNKAQKEYQGFPIYVQNVSNRANHVSVGFVHAKSFRHAVEIWMRRMRLRDGRKPRNNYNPGEFTKGEYRSLRNCGESVQFDGALGTAYFHPYPAWPVWIREGQYEEQDEIIRRTLIALFGSNLAFHPTKFLGHYHAKTQEEAYDVARYENGLGRDVVLRSTRDDTGRMEGQI